MVKPRFVQRDLEDQIAEEVTKQKTMAKDVKISEVLTLLKSGYTRFERDAEEKGKSIQAKLGLTFTQCKELFAHPKIKGLKVKTSSLNIINDIEDTNGTTKETHKAKTAEVVAVHSIDEEIEEKVEMALEKRLKDVFK